MSGQRGFIAISALLMMMVVLVSILYLINVSIQEATIVNSNQKNIQSHYLAESKILMSLKTEEYYEEQLLPMIRHYLRYGRLGGSYIPEIIIENKDLSGDNNCEKIDIEFTDEDNRKILELKTTSSISGITKGALIRMTIVNELFEIGFPIISIDIIDSGKAQALSSYLQYLRDNIEIPELHDSMVAKEILEHEDIRIKKVTKDKLMIEYYRQGSDEPIKTESLMEKEKENEVFILLRNNHTLPKLSILSKGGLDKIKLRGIIYVEGDLMIGNDFEFQGIIIVQDGRMIIDPSCEVEIKGMVFLNEYEDVMQEEFTAEYKFRDIKVYGIYLPGFIEPSIQLIKRD